MFVIKQKIQEYIDMLLGDSLSLFKKCGRNLILFELVYKLLSIAIFYPLLLFVFNFTLTKAGFKYLTNEYVITYLTSPYTIIAVLLMIVIACLYVTYEIACLSVCYDAAYHKKPIKVFRIFLAGARLMKITMKTKRINAVFHVVLVSIMMNITLLGFFATSITLPDEAKSLLIGNRYINLGYIMFLLITLLYSMGYIFIMNFMTYERDDISDAKEHSRRLMKKHGLITFLVMVGWNVIVTVTIFIIYLMMIMFIVIGVLALDVANLGIAIYLSIFKIVLMTVKIIMIVISVPMSYGVITSLFYRYRHDHGSIQNMAIFTEEMEKKKSHFPKLQSLLALLVIVAALGLDISYAVSAYNNNPFDNVEYFSQPQISSHRGDSTNAPENTISAFSSAIKELSDWIELDVHLTSDNVVVVMHDKNLYRTTGLDECVWDVSYEDIQKLDAGSWFDTKFTGEKIPTLEEVLKFVDKRVKLNIEIKYSDNENDIVKNVVALVEKYDYIDNCAIASMNYNVLEEVKETNPDIKTIYVLNVAYGKFYNLSNVDIFSINSSFVNKTIVDAIHNRGKDIFAWTVNSESKIEELANMGVDNIITDDPVSAREVIYSKYSNTKILSILSYVFDK